MIHLKEKLTRALLTVWCAFQLFAFLSGRVDALTLRAVHAAFLTLLAFLYKGKRAWPLGIVAAGAFLYFVFRYGGVAAAGGRLTELDYIAAGVAIGAVLICAYLMCRPILYLTMALLLYVSLGQYIPGAFGHNGFTLRRVLKHLFWGSSGLFGVGVGVSATYIFVFMLLGEILRASGFTRLLNDLSSALTGRSPGGPAKTAVLSSALLGMVNGSAAANVATTGAFTIPMMKKAGYSPEYAGAVEASASTGGQFTPPVMGAVGFLMAEYLNIGYKQVMLAAAAPAILYYLALMIAVSLRARRMGLAASDAPGGWRAALCILRTRGYLSLPFFILIGMILLGFTPLLSACAAMAAAILASLIKKETRMSPRMILDALLSGAKGAVSVGVPCLTIGIVIGAVSLTGLGQTIGYWLMGFAGEENLLLTGLLSAALCVLLGTGVPGIAAYVIISSVTAPALVSAGASPIAAHLFCLIYACLSNVTPPVALSAYVASGLAGGKQMKTALLASRLSLAGFILPFFFLTSPALLWGAEGAGIIETALAFLSASAGCLALAAATEGMLLRPCRVWERLLLATAALCLIQPGYLTDMIGILLILTVLLTQWRFGK